MSVEISDVLNSFAADLKKELNVIDSHEFEINKPDIYDRDNHWHKMGLCCDLVSKECTKMAVAFSKPPFPSVHDSSLLLRDIGKSLDMLISWYKSFPAEEGKVLHKVLQVCITSILSSVCDFVQSSNQEKPNEKTKVTVTTGTVWECCDSFKKLPKDNTSAVKKNIADSYKLISDAIDEIQQALNEFEDAQLSNNNDNNFDDNGDFEENEDDEWTEEDKKLIKSSVGLMMATKGLLKKTKGALSTAQKNRLDSPSETDVLMEHLSSLSPSMDDLVMMLYPPVDPQEISNQAGQISEIIKNALLFIQNSACLGTVENQSWISFIQKAVDHNFNKLKALTTNENRNGNF